MLYKKLIYNIFKDYIFIYLMTYLSVSKFLDYFPKKRFFKLLYKDEIHFDMKYKIGLNIDINNFDPFIKNGKGLYFIEQTNIYKWRTFLNNKPYWIREVFFNDLAQDAKICIIDDKFKCDKFILGPRLLFDSPLIFNENNNNNDFNEQVVKYDGLLLKYMPLYKQTDKICKYAVQQNGLALKYVNKQTPIICEYAVKQNAYALEFVKEQTEDICLYSVQQNGLTLKYVINQTLFIIQTAIRLYPRAYIQIVNPSYELNKILVQINGLVLEYIDNQTDELCNLAVIENGLALKYCKYQNIKICRTAIEENPYALKYVKLIYKTYELCKMAIEMNNLTIMYVEYPTKELFDICYKKN